MERSGIRTEYSNRRGGVGVCDFFVPILSLIAVAIDTNATSTFVPSAALVSRNVIPCLFAYFCSISGIRREWGGVKEGKSELRECRKEEREESGILPQLYPGLQLHLRRFCCQLSSE